LYEGVKVVNTLNLLIFQQFQGTFSPLFMNNSGYKLSAKIMPALQRNRGMRQHSQYSIKKLMLNHILQSTILYSGLICINKPLAGLLYLPARDKPLTVYGCIYLNREGSVERMLFLKATTKAWLKPFCRQII